MLASEPHEEASWKGSLPSSPKLIANDVLKLCNVSTLNGCNLFSRLFWSIDGRRINNLRYADDILILAKSEIELLFITNKLRSIKEKYGLNNDYW